MKNMEKKSENQIAGLKFQLHVIYTTEIKTTLNGIVT